MPHDSRPPPSATPILATDLDGTLIPLEGNTQNQRDLETLAGELVDHAVQLVFVTGRHLEIVEEAIDQHSLPRPEWILCDVGSSIYRRSPAGFTAEAAYQDHLAGRCTSLSRDALQQNLADIEGLTLQEEVKQGPFKLSYYVAPDQLESRAAEVDARLLRLDAPYSLIHSVDPFTGDGLIDLLPRGVSKAYALDWWRTYCRFDAEQIVFAGDSGNDWAALIAGYRAIVVGNADRQLAERVTAFHARQQWHDRLHLATAPATSGVLEGCRAFGLLTAGDGSVSE